jgi:hypothetical protein
MAVYRYRRCRRGSVPRIVDTMMRSQGLILAGPLYERTRQHLAIPARRAASRLKRRFMTR